METHYRFLKKSHFFFFFFFLPLSLMVIWWKERSCFLYSYRSSIWMVAGGGSNSTDKNSYATLDGRRPWPSN